MSEGRHPLLTLREAAAWLGWGNNRFAARRLERRLVAKEKAIGRSLMVRTQGAERETRRVTVSMLRAYLPEARPSKVDELKRDMVKRLEGLDERIREGAAGYVAEHVEPRLDELWERDEQIAETLNQLGARVAVLLSPSKPAQAHSVALESRGSRARGSG
jgi:hypothetical protein